MNRVIFLILLITCLSACKKADDTKLLGPGIILTSDVYPLSWHPLRSFLSDHHAKITFYVPAYDRIKASDKYMLHDMYADGHEVAHHTMTHPHVPDYIKAHGDQVFLDKEIFALTDLLKADGYDPKTFAYPYGSASSHSDELLLKYFKSVRKIISPVLNKRLEDMDQIYYRYSDMKVFYGVSIDKKNKIPLDQIFDAMEKAKNSRQTISLYCHDIDYNGEAGEYSVEAETLKQIILKAESLGLKFYTATEVSRK